jgi:ABC-type nitrate/sulfonate/bicarbonate transport system substrate-binding protein
MPTTRDGDPGGPLKTLHVGAVSRNYFNLPLWIAVHGGFFEAEGLSVQVSLIEGIEEVTERLRNGGFDLALNVTENTILAREHGADLQVIGGNVNRLPFSFIARPGINGYEGLRGGRVGVSSLKAGSSSLVMKLLADQGLHHPQDYTLLAVGPILARWKLLQSGEIDAGLQGAPLDYIAIDQGYVDLGSPRRLFPDFQFTSLDVSAGWARRNEDTVVRFLRAFIRAHHAFYANREEACRIACLETGVEARYAARAWDDYTREGIFPRDGRANIDGIQTLIEVSSLIRDLKTRATMRAQAYVDHGYLEIAEKSLA